MSVSDLFAGVVGQQHAQSQLSAAVARPLHAYLLVGPPGLGQKELTRGFAAGLLCAHGGCGTCHVCRRVLHGVHPDLVEFEREGAALSVDDARAVVRLAQRRPLEAMRQVIVVPDVHLARVAAPVLLKTLEDPAAATVLVLLADSVTPDMATVASRCVRVDLVPPSPQVLTAWLESEGHDPEVARSLALAARGSPERARLLAGDPHLAERHQLWMTVPGRLDGTGSSAATLASELLQSAEQATEPLRARHQQEVETFALEAKSMGQRAGTAKKTLEDRHRREERRWRTDELRVGLAALSGAYRHRMESTSDGDARADERLAALASAVSATEEVARELIRNPNETLILQALLVRLSVVPA